MHENTRAALPGDLVARLRDASTTAAARGRDELDAEVYHACMDAADALAAQAAEIARLRAALERIIAMPSYGVWHMDLAVAVARAALSRPPASDGECCQRTRLRGAPCPAGRTCPHDTPPPPGWPTLENVR